MSRSRLAAALAALAAVIVLYAGTFAWAADRYDAADSFYSHGYLIPIVSIFLFVRAWRTSDPRASMRPSGWGLPVLAFGLLLLLVSHLEGLHVTAGLSLLPVLAGLALLLGGRRAMRAAAFPIGFLLAAVPIPLFLVSDLSLRLKLMVASGAAATLDAIGLDVTVAGSILRVGTHDLLIGDPCSGLRSLIALMAIAALFAHLSDLPPLRRWALFLLGAPSALLSNLLRIVILGVIAGAISGQAASSLHDLSGWVVYLIALVLLAAQARLLRIGVRPDPPRPAPDLPAAAEPVPSSSALGLAPPRTTAWRAVMPAFGVALMGAAIPLAYRLERPPLSEAPMPELQSIPYSFGGWDGEPREVSERTRELLGTDNVVMRTYRRQHDVGAETHLCVVYSADDRRSVHPPEVCYRGGGGEIVNRAQVSVPRSAGALLANALLVELPGDARQEVVLYWYRFGPDDTASYLTQQWRMALGTLLGREGAGMLIRLSALVARGQDPNSVAADLVSFAESVLPYLDTVVP